jgi:hypothetical protein
MWLYDELTATILAFTPCGDPAQIDSVSDVMRLYGIFAAAEHAILVFDLDLAANVDPFPHVVVKFDLFLA